MGCTPSTSYSIKNQMIFQEKNLPTSARSASELFTIKQFRRTSSMKSSRLKNVCNDAPTAIVIEKALLPKDISFILNTLHKSFLFKDLDEDVKSKTIRSMKYFKLANNEKLFTQGDYGNYLFIVIKGCIELLSNNKSIEKISRGGMLGENAIMHDSKRRCTAITNGLTELWGLERNLFKIALKTVALQQYHENKNLLEKCELFSVFDSFTRNRLLELLVIQKFENEVILREGEYGENLYIVKSGRVKCTIDGNFIKDLTENDYFGEQSLLNDNIRTATITAIGIVVTASIGRTDLENILNANYEKIVYQNSQKISILKDRILNRLINTQIQKIINNTEIKKYKDQKDIIKKGKLLTKLIIVLKGNVLRDGEELEKYKCIGSEFLLGIENSNSNYKANGIVECAEISKNSVELLLDGNYSDIVLQNDLIQLFKNMPLLSEFNEDLLRSILKSSKIQKYEDSEIIFNQDTYGKEFFIVHSGEVIITIDGKYVRTLIKDSYFGEKALIQNELRTASAIAKGVTQIFVIKQEAFRSIIDNDIQNQLITRMDLQDYSIELEDLSIIKSIGKGAFGNVFLVANRKTKILYALKSILFSDIKKLKIQDTIKSSETVLLQLESSLIMKLIKTLSDDERIYFLLEYIPGMTLYQVIADFRPISQSQIIFYISNIILMLKHLHSRNIVHRDLKPENLMVDARGYLKLIDFDAAVIVEERCYTIAGTPHYMAPEMIRGEGYSLPVDYWSLGVIFYELVYDYLPFGENFEDPFEIYHAILTENVKYRSKFSSYQKIIGSLLEPNPGLRANYQQLMGDEFFSDIQ